MKFPLDKIQPISFSSSLSEDRETCQIVTERVLASALALRLAVSTGPCGHLTERYLGSGEVAGSILHRGGWFVRLQSRGKQIQ